MCEFVHRLWPSCSSRDASVDGKASLDGGSCSDLSGRSLDQMVQPIKHLVRHLVAIELRQAMCDLHRRRGWRVRKPSMDEYLNAIRRAHPEGGATHRGDCPRSPRAL